MDSKYTQNSKPKTQTETRKKSKRVGIWILFSFLALAVAMGLGALYYNYRKDKEKTYVSNPKVGDIYEMELKTGRFTTAKVLEVSKDSIYVTYNSYETDQAKGISEIDIESNYGFFKGAYTKKRIEELFSQDSIFAIDRN